MSFIDMLMQGLQGGPEDFSRTSGSGGVPLPAAKPEVIPQAEGIFGGDLSSLAPLLQGLLGDSQQAPPRLSPPGAGPIQRAPLGVSQVPGSNPLSQNFRGRF